METRQTTPPAAGAGHAARRGAALFSAAGAALGGAAGTADWPIVGSSVGAVQGALVGIVVGAAIGLAVSQIGRWTQSAWASRAVSGVLGGVVAILGSAFYRGPITVPTLPAAVLVAVAIVTSIALGPPLSTGAPSAQTRADKLLGRFVVWGLAAGTMLGAVAGLIVGVHVYLATAPFAAVEGAVFGAVNGVALSCAAAGIYLLTRLRFPQ